MIPVTGINASQTHHLDHSIRCNLEPVASQVVHKTKDKNPSDYVGLKDFYCLAPKKKDICGSRILFWRLILPILSNVVNDVRQQICPVMVLIVIIIF